MFCLSRILSILAVAITLACAGMVSAHAAPITWATPVNETGLASDVINSGTLIAAVSSGGATTVNGVAFAGPVTLSAGVLGFTGDSLVHGSGFNIIGILGLAPSSWDPGYQILAGGASFGEITQGTRTLTIGGLTAGQRYLLQIFEPFWDLNWGGRFSDGVNSSAELNVGGAAREGNPAASVPQYVTGTFTADGSTQTLYVTSNTHFAAFGALQVRTDESSVPEPGMVGMLGLATVLLAGARRRRAGL